MKKVDWFRTDIGFAVRIGGEFAGACVRFNASEKPYHFCPLHSSEVYRGDSVFECIFVYLQAHPEVLEDGGV